MSKFDVNINDLYLRLPPFSFNAIKPGDVAIFSNGKGLIIEKKVKPDNKGQNWFGLVMNGYAYVYDDGINFESSGKCSNGSGMDIKYILKTGINIKKPKCKICGVILSSDCNSPAYDCGGDCKKCVKSFEEN